MKKIAVIVLAVLLVPVGFALDVLNIGLLDGIALAGSANVPVAMELNNNETVDLFEFTVQHPSYLTFKNITPSSRMINATIVWNDINSTHADVAGFVDSSIAPGSGKILDLKFDVDLLAVPGVYDVKIINPIFLSLNITEDLPFNVTNGQFTIV